MHFDFHQNISSILAILFIALLSTLLGIITVNTSDDVVAGYSQAITDHQQTLKQ